MSRTEKLILLSVLATLVVASALFLGRAAYGGCGGGCCGPACQPARPVAQSPPKEGWHESDDPDQLAWWEGGAQKGNWVKSERLYYPLLAPGHWGDGVRLDGGPERPGAPGQNFGLTVGWEPGAGGEKFYLGAREVTRTEGVAALTGDGQLVDDSAKPWFTVVGPKEFCARVLADATGHAGLKQALSDAKVREFRETDPIVTHRKFPRGITYQEPKGKAYFTLAEYPGPELLAKCIEQKSAAPLKPSNPINVPGLPQLPPAAWLALLFGGAWLVFRRK